jgi:hypothetical protein
MSVAEALQTTSKASSSSSSGFVVPRKCACGGSAGFSGECEECKRRKMLGRALQPTRAINEPDDEYEREADRVAEQVMRMPEPARESGGAGLRVPPLVQRRVNGAGRPGKRGTPGTPGMLGAGAAPSLVDEVLASPSQPLDAAARTFLEPRFGESLHDVRLHTDVRAQQAARSIDARAFTVGRHIVLGAREYVPHSTAGTHLLAHELTHVLQQTGGASVLARKSSAALSWSGPSTNLDESAVAVTEEVVADQAESAAEVTGASTTGELGRIDTARPDEQTEQPEAVLVEKPAFPQAEPAPLVERMETSATLKAAAESPAARPAVGVEIGTPSEIGRQFNALPPSIQAETYARLGKAQRTSFANQALETQVSITELSASLDGVLELPATPLVRTPPLAPSPAGHPLPSSSEPVVQIPQAPARPPVSHPSLPTTQAAEPKALEQALGAIDQTSAIATTLERPAIPLEGTADPAALGTLESTAADEAARSLDAARAGVLDVSPEIVQPLALDEVVAVPALADVDLAEPTHRIEGMDKLAAYALSPRDREIVDARIGPSMQDAAAGAQSELDQHEQAFDLERTRLHMEADTEAAATQARAEEDQRSEVEQGREGLAAEQEQTLAQQEAAVDGALGDLAISRKASRQTIDDRLATDRATVDEVYKAAEADAQTAVEKGQAEAGALKGATVAKVNAESWWDWAIDTWQGFVQWFASQLVAVWERVNQEIAGLFDRAIQLATRVVNGAVGFVKLALSAYYDVWLGLVDRLLGDTFPELAAAFRTAAEAIKATVFKALDLVAATYLKALRFVADTLVAGLDAGLLAYKSGVAAYLALWEAIQQGQWDQIGRTVLTALLTAVGIDPAEFFATFSKLDEVVDDVIADPGVVGRNAVAAVALGFQQFGTHFIGNFTAAFVEWITGAAAIKLPETFSLAGIFDVVCQVLNLTKAYLHKKAVQHLGEGAVAAIEELTEAAWAFVSSGWAGLWNLVKDKLTTLVDDVVVATGTWLVEKAILVAGRWIAGLAATMGLSVIVEALIALWQFVMWLKDQFHRFWMIVKSTVDSVHDFVKGKIEPAADKIEGTLQDLIVPAIDLVAKLLNISNIAKKVEHIIEAVRGVIDGAIDGVINGLKKTLKSGARKVKTKAVEVAGKVRDWWNAKSEFKDTSGESHTLFFKGEGPAATLYVASDEPSTMTEFLRKKDQKNEHVKAAQKRYEAIQTDRASLVAAGITPVEKQRIANALQGKLDALGDGPLSQLFGVGVKDFPPPILPVMQTGVQAMGFTADYISRHKDSVERVGEGTRHEGTEPTSDPPGYADLRNAKTRDATTKRWTANFTDNENSTVIVSGRRDWYVRVHLLTELLGGKGVDSNLTPGLHSVNQDLKLVEHAAFAKSAEEPIWYRFKIRYHNAVPIPSRWPAGRQYEASNYPSVLQMTWGTYAKPAKGSPPDKVARVASPGGESEEFKPRLPSMEGADPHEVAAGEEAGKAAQHADFVELIANALKKLKSLPEMFQAIDTEVRALAAVAQRYREDVRTSHDQGARLELAARQTAADARERTRVFIKEIAASFDRVAPGQSPVVEKIAAEHRTRTDELRRRVAAIQKAVPKTEGNKPKAVLDALRGKRTTKSEDTLLGDLSRKYINPGRFESASRDVAELSLILDDASFATNLQAQLNAVVAAVRAEPFKADDLEAAIQGANGFIRKIAETHSAGQGRITELEEPFKTYEAALAIYRRLFKQDFA